MKYVSGNWQVYLDVSISPKYLFNLLSLAEIVKSLKEMDQSVAKKGNYSSDSQNAACKKPDSHHPFKTMLISLTEISPENNELFFCFTF